MCLLCCFAALLSRFLVAREMDGGAMAVMPVALDSRHDQSWDCDALVDKTEHEVNLDIWIRLEAYLIYSCS